MGIEIIIKDNGAQVYEAYGDTVKKALAELLWFIDLKYDNKNS